MTCTAPEIGKLITLYEFDQLSDNDKRKFEAHLLSCDYCFQSLYALSPVVERMREDPERFLPAVEEREPAAPVWVWVKLKNKIVGVISDGWEAIGRIPFPVRIAIPATATAIVLLLFLLRPAAQLSDFAHIEPVPYRSLQVKSGAAISDAERLFEEGMRSYVQKDYSNAIAKLALAVRQDSTNASFHFYLGLCYLLSESIDPAIAHFQRAIALGGNSVLEKAYWYLGNAWLLKGERVRALEAFRRVLEMEGDYEWEAEEMIGKIEKLSRK